MIPPETVSAIHDSARIEDVVGEYVTLKRRGTNMLGLCPFHNEKTPSFSVSPVKGIFKCFGCGKAGNSVKFIMEHDHLSYPEALRQLAKKYGIPIAEVNTEEAREEQQLHDSLYIINDFAQKYFTDNLLNKDEGKNIGLSYFVERGFRKDIIEKFQLGYSNDSFEAFRDHATSKGYKPDLMQKVGLLGKKNERYYDFMRARVMFPIHSISGKVIAFAGRTLSADKKIPKYVNSPESEIYFKSKELYGMNFALNSIRKNDNCYLVEGYTDVISLHQADIENVVASSGTSLTVDQIRKIKRFTPNVTVLYDGDAAGVNAALRGTDMILEADMNVRVVLLPDGDDPDSFIRKTGKAGFEEFVKEQAKDFVFFKTTLLLEQAQNDPIKKAGLIKSIVETIAKIPDPIKRVLYIKECSVLLEVGEKVIINEVNKIKQNKFADYQNKRAAPKKFEIPDLPVEQYPEEQRQSNKWLNFDETLELLEREIVQVLFCYGEKKIDDYKYVAEFICDQLEASNLTFNNQLCMEVLSEYRMAIKEGRLLTNRHFTEHAKDEISALCTELTFRAHEISENWEIRHSIIVKKADDNFKDNIVYLLNRFKLKHLTKLLSANSMKMKTESDSTELRKLINVHQQLLVLQRELSGLLGIDILPERLN